MRKLFVLGTALFGAGAFCSAAAYAGPVQILSQDRRATATARPGGGGDPVVENITAPDSGLFDETATADASGEGFVSRASSSLVSRLGNDGLHFAGTLTWETQDTVRPAAIDSATADASVVGEVRFRLDEAYDYTFSLGLDVTEQSTSGAESGEGFTFVFFEDVQGQIAPGESGTLQPGTYFLQFNRSTGSLVSGDGLDRHSVDFALDLDLAPSDGSSEPNPIPLPPAAWAALSTMGMIGLTRAAGRLRRGN